MHSTSKSNTEQNVQLVIAVNFPCFRVRFAAGIFLLQIKHDADRKWILNLHQSPFCAKLQSVQTAVLAWKHVDLLVM